MEDNWDLHAVVRGCATLVSTTSSTTTTTSSVSCSVSSPAFGSSAPSCGFYSFLPSESSSQVLPLSSNPFEARNSIQELHELSKPFSFKSQPFPSFQTPSSSSSSSSSSSLSSFSYSSSSSPNLVQAQQKQQQQLQNSSAKSLHHAVSATTPRSKRRKNQVKKVCEMAAENLSSDIWAWRKYGQKPIKGSPYPRGYYRCSSSKGCLARKQVERNKSDPTKFIVTYTGDHNHPAPTHRNSLAGSTRQKPQPPQVAIARDTQTAFAKPVSPSTSGVEEEEVSLAPKSESEGDFEDLIMNDDDNGVEENEFGSLDMELTDDFFEGLDFDDPFSDSVGGSAFPALVANSATTAGGGR